MKTSLFWLTVGTMAVSSLAARAQNAGSSTHEQSRAEVEDIGVISESAGPTGDGKSGPAGDGKSAPAPAPSPFRFNFDTRAGYTSNARLSGNHASSDFIFSPTLEVGYHTALGHGFAFDSLGRIESGIYANHDERTFIGYSLTNTFEWRPRPNLPRLYVGVEPYRYDGFDGQGRITQAVGTSVGTDWGYSFNNGHSLAYLGYSYTDYFSDPEIDNRLTHTVTLGYVHVFSPKLTGQAFYQYVHEFYPDTGDRQDSRHVVGLNLNYQLRDHTFVTMGGSFVDNDSNQFRASYQSAGVTLGLNCSY